MPAWRSQASPEYLRRRRAPSYTAAERHFVGARHAIDQRVLREAGPAGYACAVSVNRHRLYINVTTRAGEKVAARAIRRHRAGGFASIGKLETKFSWADRQAVAAQIQPRAPTGRGVRVITPRNDNFALAASARACPKVVIGLPLRADEETKAWARAQVDIYGADLVVMAFLGVSPV